MAVYTDKKEGGKATEMRCLLKGERDSFVKVFDGDNKGEAKGHGTPP